MHMHLTSLLMIVSLWISATARAADSKDDVKIPPAVAKKFSAIEVEKPFDAYLFANLLLMESTGAKIIRLPNGRQVILAVASTALENNSGKERLRAERVCRSKALASVVAEKEGVQVFRLERLNETTSVKQEGEKETAKSVSELLEVTKTKVQGLTRDMPVIGRWRSREGDVFYMAIGILCDKNGEPIRDNP